MSKAIVFLLFLLICFGCKPAQTENFSRLINEKEEFDYSKFLLKEGDILFQDSDCGPFCESIEKVTFGIHGSKFSHVGLVTQKDDGDFIILEAITDGVVETPLDIFFARSFDEDDNSKVVVGRMKDKHKNLIPQAIDYARTKLGKAYDDVFDITNDKYYCSELIYESFKYANKETPVFQLQKMTYVDPETNKTFPIWADYFKKLNVPIPENKPGLNPGGMSKSDFIDIVHFYGKPDGYQA